MARRLPWKTTAAVQATRRNSKSAEALPPPTPPTRDASPRLHPVQAGLSEPLRSPSTSPPPEPPQQRLMIPGDDRYRMVEDEFLHAAQRLTAHLHRAEYVRLRALAKTRHAATTCEMERPVVAALSAAASRRRHAARRDAAQRTLLHLPPSGSSLHSLMETPRLSPAPVATRAAAGYQRPARDALTPPATTASTPRHHRQVPSTTPRHARLSTPPPTSRAVLTADANTPERCVDTVQHRGMRDQPGNVEPAHALPNEDQGDDDDDDHLLGFKRRRVRREKSRRERVPKPEPSHQPKTLSTDAIPSFL